MNRLIYDETKLINFNGNLLLEISFKTHSDWMNCYSYLKNILSYDRITGIETHTRKIVRINFPTRDAVFEFTLGHL